MRMIDCPEPCMCGADDCPKCHPEIAITTRMRKKNIKEKKMSIFESISAFIALGIPLIAVFVTLLILYFDIEK